MPSPWEKVWVLLREIAAGLIRGHGWYDVKGEMWARLSWLWGASS
jgi:hypothetical protein